MEIDLLPSLVFFEEQAADRLCFAPSPYGALPLAGPVLAARTAPRSVDVSRGQGGTSQPSQRGGDFFPAVGQELPSSLPRQLTLS